MVTKEEYAIFSATEYNDARGDTNQLKIPPDWNAIAGTSDINNPLSGLSITAYQKGSDIVIACKGTDFLLDTDILRTASDLSADLALGLGLGVEFQ